MYILQFLFSTYFSLGLPKKLTTSTAMDAFAHAIGSEYHIPHGELCAIVCPMVVEYMANIFPEKVRKIADAMSLEVSENASNEEVAALIGNALRKLRVKLGLPKFSDYSFGYEDLPHIADAIMKENCVQILHMCVKDHKVTADDFLIPMQKEYNLAD